MQIKAGTVSNIIYFKLVNVTTGQPETGVTITDLDLSYVRDQAAAVKSDAIAHGAVTDAYSANECIEVENTNTPGLYRADFPDAAFVAGVERVQLCVIDGASQTIDPAYIEVELSTNDNDDIINAISGIGTAGGAALNTDVADDNYNGGIPGVTSGTTKVGTETGTYTNTSHLDGAYHIMTHDTQVVDIVYQFLCGGGSSIVAVVWTGILNPNKDTLTVSLWDHIAPGWEAIAVIDGQTSTTNNVVRNLIPYARHIGTSAAELGKVYMRLQSAAAYNHILRTDQVYVSYGITSRTVGYADGAVWVDTVNGIAGTESFVNGIADNPSLTWADALTIAGNIGLEKFHISNGSTITLSGNSDNYTLVGSNWTLVLNGQSCSDMYAQGATDITGTCTGANPPDFFDCMFGNATLPPCYMTYCGFKNTITMGSAGDFSFDHCHSMVAGVNTPSLDFGAGLNASNVNLRMYSGGIEVENMGAGVGSYNMSIEGHGQIIINANCSATSLIAVRGHFRITDNAAGAVSLSEDARYDTTQIQTASNAALVANNLDHLCLTATGGTDMTAELADNTIFSRIISQGDTSAFIPATHGLLPIRVQGDAAWITAVGFAVAGDLMGLVDDAITAVKYDETTAFPVRSDDAGVTQIARVGADGDTLETLSDQIDNTPANVAAVILATPAQLLVTDASGHVTAENMRGTDNAALAATALSTAQWTNARAGYLDNISIGAVALAVTALSTATWTAAKAGFIDIDISSRAPLATALTDVTWTDARAGYLDNISAGAVALDATALSNVIWTNAKAGYLDVIISSRSSHNAGDVAALILDTPANLLVTDASGHVISSNMRGTDNAALAITALSTAQWTNARAGYLDNINIVGTIASDTDVANAHAVTDGLIDGLHDFNPVTQQVIVATNNDKLGYSLAAGHGLATAVSLAAVAANVIFIKNIAEADEKIETGVSGYYEVVTYVKDTTTELKRKGLYNQSGSPIGNVTDTVFMRLESAP